MTFGKNVKTVREKLFLTQAELAAELGVSFATVNRWETERCLPSIKAKKAFHEYCMLKKVENE